MIQRTSGTPCLGERVSALADGSLAADVRDRALAHVTSCEQCREALEVERLLVQRLRELPAPAPSNALLQQLLALGETGGPVAPRSGRVAGTPRQPTTALSGLSTGPTARATPAVRPGMSRPSGRREHRRAGRVLAAAGAFGVGVLAATTIGSALPTQRPVVGPPAASLSVQRDGGVRGGINNGGTSNSGGTINNASFMRLTTPGTLARPTTVPAVGPAESSRPQSGR
jgi:hypothetical protein